MSLDNVLSDEEPVTAPPETPAEPEAPAEVPKEPEAPKEPVKEPAKEPAKAEDFTEKEKALLATARDERHKRQLLEARLKEMEGKEPPKTFWDNPEEALQQFRGEISNMVTRTKLDTSESIARQRYTDFDENIQVFAQLLQQTPGMQQQWLASADPAEYAYKAGKNYRDLQQAGGLDQLKQKMEKELRLKIEQELKQKQEDQKKQAAALPGSLSDVQGGNPTKPVWTGPTPLEDILE